MVDGGTWGFRVAGTDQNGASAATALAFILREEQMDILTVVTKRGFSPVSTRKHFNRIHALLIRETPVWRKIPFKRFYLPVEIILLPVALWMGNRVGVIFLRTFDCFYRDVMPETFPSISATRERRTSVGPPNLVSTRSSIRVACCCSISAG